MGTPNSRPVSSTCDAGPFAMTRAGEKLYRDDFGPGGSVVLALLAHPVFLRGAWSMLRLLCTALLIAVLFGLG